MEDVIKIIIYQNEYKSQIQNLIVHIQQNEFSIPITISDQPDLGTIPEFYQVKNGNFWIALHDNKVVGTIALLDIDNKQAVLRKMFVDKEFRGKKYNTASLLLETLFAWANNCEITDIYLGTISKFIAAHKFYEKNDFILIDKTSLPTNFPLMKVDDVFYKYVCKETR